jgi:hypothetical protein
MYIPTRIKSHHEEDHNISHFNVDLLHFIWSTVGTHHNNLGFRFHSTTTST